MFEVWQERDNEIAALRDERNELKYETGRLAHECNRLSVEVYRLESNLKMAVSRIEDMLEGDDGQAYKEAEKFLALLEKSK